MASARLTVVLADSQPSHRLGRYRLYREIASGGMASVHLGRLLGPVGFSRTVAIKRLHPHFAKDPEFVAMFLDEARLAAAIQHPNVVPILDVVATAGELFLVMDYVQGATLSQLSRIARKKGLKVPRRIASAIVSGTLHGLHAAHEARSDRNEPLDLIHRDVSPQNILVGVDGVARVLDFGVAKATRRIQETESGRIKGKFSYMAPEQIRHDRVDRRVDLFAAGIVLWEVLTSQRLFVAEEPGRIMAKILDGGVPPLEEHVSGLPTAVQNVIDLSLAQDPRDRYATAREMAIALEKALPPVLPSEVGDWVEQIAGELLNERAALIAEIQSQPEAPDDPRSRMDELARMLDSPVERTAQLRSTPPPSSDGAATVKTPESRWPLSGDNSAISGISATSLDARHGSQRRYKPLFASLFATVLLLVVYAGMRVLSPSEQVPTLRAAATIPAIVLADPSFSAKQKEAPVAAPVPPAPEQTTEPRKAPAPTRVVPLPRRAKRRPDCSPPYTVSPDGIQVFKPECI